MWKYFGKSTYAFLVVCFYSMEASANHCGDYTIAKLKPVDCAEILELGYNYSAVYTIWPKNKNFNGRSIDVYCEMHVESGGWTVIQRRGDYLRPVDFFYKDWENYKRGFGNIEKDFWLGNEAIYALTNQKYYSVRIDLVDVKGEHRYAVYDLFYIESEKDKYRLTIQDYSGDANDSMIAMHNGMQFTTKDQDNDRQEGNCAIAFKGGWWYNNCHTANLNGLDLRGNTTSFADGIIWHAWKGYHESLAVSEIMIRPKNFREAYFNRL